MSKNIFQLLSEKYSISQTTELSGSDGCKIKVLGNEKFIIIIVGNGRVSPDGNETDEFWFDIREKLTNASAKQIAKIRKVLLEN